MTTLTKSNGFPSLRSMMEDFWNVEGFFGKPLFAKELLPAVNIKEKKDKFELEVSAPGFKKEDFKVSIDDGLLTISAETETENEEIDNDYTRKEFSRSSFSRSFSLPENIIEDEIDAAYRDGLLKIALKKSEKNKKQVKQVNID